MSHLLNIGVPNPLPMIRELDTIARYPMLRIGLGWPVCTRFYRYQHDDRPVVSTNVSAVPEAIEHAKDGLLVESESPLNLAKALIELFESKHLRNRLGNAGYLKMERMFQIERNIMGLKKLLLQGLVLDKNLGAQNLVSAE